MQQSRDRNETYDLTVTRVFDAPVERVWEAWGKENEVKRWWGPTGFTVPLVEMDFREGGTTLVSMQAPQEMGGFVIYNTWEYTKIVPNERIEFALRFADKDRTMLNPQDIGIPAGVPEEVPHVITFKGVSGKTEMHYAEFGYTTEEAVATSKSGLDQVLDKLANLVEQQ